MLIGKQFGAGSLAVGALLAGASLSGCRSDHLMSETAGGEGVSTAGNSGAPAHAGRSSMSGAAGDTSVALGGNAAGTAGDDDAESGGTSSGGTSGANAGQSGSAGASAVAGSGGQVGNAGASPGGSAGSGNGNGAGGPTGGAGIAGGGTTGIGGGGTTGMGGGGTTGMGGGGLGTGASSNASAGTGGGAGSSSAGESGTGCGNDVLDPGELCDPQFTVNDCGADCRAITSDACFSCENDPLTCQEFVSCDSALGAASAGSPAAGTSKKILCNETLDCVRDAKCAAESNAPIKCYCGSASAPDCQAGLGNGKCKSALERSLETTDFATITQRIGNKEYAGGVAMGRIDCDQTFCSDACF